MIAPLQSLRPARAVRALALPFAGAFAALAFGGCAIQAATDDLGALPGQPRALLVDDFDGNGTDDVLVGYGSDYFGITRATQDGYGFWSRSDLGTVVGGSELLASTDLEGDGAPDVIAAARGLGSFNVLRNRGDGTFSTSAKEVAPASPPGSTRIRAIASATAPSGTRLVAVAFETDDPDASVRPRSVVTYRASGGTLANANFFQLFDPVPGDARVLRLHDVDADGRLDLLIGTAAGTVQIYRGSGPDGSFASAPTTLTAPGQSAAVTALVAGDAKTIAAAPVQWPLDVHDDVLVGFAGQGEVYGWRGQGGMAFGAADAMGVINGGSRTFFALAVDPGGSGGWGGMATGQASAFAQTNGGYGFASLRIGGGIVCDATTGTLFPNTTGGDIPVSAAFACVHSGQHKAVVAIPGRARLSVPGPLALGSMRAGTSGAVTTATLSQTDFENSGGGVGAGRVGIRRVWIEGADAGDFELVRGEIGVCYLPSLPEDEPCRPQVRFKPRSPGAKQARLVIDSDAYRAPGTPPHSIALSGTGTGALASAPASAALGDVAFGASASAPLTIGNSGNQPLAIASLALEQAGSGWSVAPGTCDDAPVAPGASCSATVRYAPPTRGAAAASLRIVSDGVGTEPVIALSARGIGSGVTAAPVAFGDVAVGTTRGATAEIVNSGEIALQISSVVAFGPDAGRVTVDATDCLGGPIAPAGRCDVGVAFAPGARGALDATLRVASNAPSSPNVVALAARAVQGAAQAPAELALGPVRVGFFAERAVTVENGGDAPLRLGALAIAGPVALTADGCSAATLAVGAECSATIRFVPAAVGPLDARLLIPNDGDGGERVVELTGLGLPTDDEPGGREPGGREPGGREPGSREPGGGQPGGDPGARAPTGPVGPAPGGPGPPAPSGRGGDAGRAALALTAVGRVSVRRGGTVHLQARLRSVGTRAVAGATLRVRLPAALRWQPPARAGDRRPRATRTVAVALGRLAPGAARSVTLVVRAVPRARRAPVEVTLRATGADVAPALATSVVRVR
ncbi:choice-of-anchor D domain-containing protein [Conexibacter woesei]|uniref:FG-GAP repeat protein n=1 Tax=Conexibacter woesei (strain DSM 14684 / CCUG 47730 / CIP 108061 / JCM 11494 / NBRC 100937 / ID131577) TaxID=469383 RepID=D3F370_CONWI|nr:choice-of-anchor D domain-containing protein [Conexibacter woesei]ADB50350.1 FG-GAP repeat protein [Conexibacter woesei DSM 14684]